MTYHSCPPSVLFQVSVHKSRTLHANNTHTRPTKYGSRSQPTGQLTHSRLGLETSVQWGSGTEKQAYQISYTYQWGQCFQFNGPDHLTLVRFLSTNRIQDHVQWSPHESWLRTRMAVWTARGFFAPSFTIIVITNEQIIGSRWTENISHWKISRYYLKGFSSFFLQQFHFKCRVNCNPIESFLMC